MPLPDRKGLHIVVSSVRRSLLAKRLVRKILPTSAGQVGRVVVVYELDARSEIVSARRTLVDRVFLLVVSDDRGLVSFGRAAAGLLVQTQSFGHVAAESELPLTLLSAVGVANDLVSFH